MWFVASRVDGAFPHLALVGEAEPGADAFGPFPSRRLAGRFAEALADAFDLCRCYAGGRQIPVADGCAYKQMGRCGAPCDGSMSMADYRHAVQEAVRFAGGDRQPLRQRLAAGMREAAAAMDYERAAFVCDRGAVAAAGTLQYPPVSTELAAVCDACDALSAEHAEMSAPDRQRMAIVSAYLFSRKPERGLWFRRSEVTPTALMEAIGGATEALKVRLPARRRRHVTPGVRNSP